MPKATALRTQSYETRVSHADGGEQNLLSLRLPPSDISTLRFYFNGLESEVGLGSNCGAMIERLKAAEVITCAHRRGRRTRDRCQTCDRMAACSSCGACVACGELGWGPHVISAQPGCGARRELEPVEGWACWTNHLGAAMGTAVHDCYLALMRMYEAPNGIDHVRRLFKMYAAGTPAKLFTDYPSLGDLVPLATETRTVTERMGGGLSPLETMHALLAAPRMEKVEGKKPTLEVVKEHARKARLIGDTARAIKADAHRMLISASQAYRTAITDVVLLREAYRASDGKT